jgi:hypothetical protein
LSLPLWRRSSIGALLTGGALGLLFRSLLQLIFCN